MQARRAAAAIEVIECVERQRPRQLPGPIGAEVEVDDRVAVGHATVAVDHAGADELVALPRFVGGFDGRCAARDVAAVTVHDRLPGELRPVPAPIAIHGEVAAADGRHVRTAPDARLERGQELDGGARRRVPSIGEGVERHALGRQPDVLRQLHHGDDVLVDGVNPARADEPHQVQRAAVLDGVVGGHAQDGIADEFAVVDGLADSRQVLQHREARPQVEMADLRVAHLALRKANVLPGSREPTGRPGGRQVMPGGHLRGEQRVALRVVVQAEAVEHAQDHRSRRHQVRTSAAARTIAAKRDASSEAPPTSAPSTSGMAKRSPELSGVQLPP